MQNLYQYIKSILNLIFLNFLNFHRLNGDWGLGIGDWGLGIGNWGLGIGPNPQSPIPNPQSPIPIYINININNKIFSMIKLKFK